jgi:hypothetical protein
MATIAYGHFPIEHVHHHATVGIAHEGTTPPLGQGVWAFLMCNAAFSFRSAWNIEGRRQSRRRLRLVGNRFVQQWLLTALIVTMFFSVAGAAGLVLFCGASRLRDLHDGVRQLRSALRLGATP